MENAINKIFTGANILLPKIGTDMSKWSVVACDQYTSEREYWESVKEYIGNEDSTLRMIFPEIYLEDEGFEERIKSISSSMNEYINQGVFTEYSDAFVYVKRQLADGKTRHGIVGKIDLEYYDYAVGTKLPIRATEGTVLERIPPRVKIREQCPLESPHVMLLIDDGCCEIIEAIAQKLEELEKIYEFPLMKDSGSISGYLLNSRCEEILNNGIERLSSQSGDSLLFAVGDGNHSLATAKKCYENLKIEIGDRALESKARYALVELVNLHESSLEFEAIHRVMFDVEPEHVCKKLCEHFKQQTSVVLEDNDLVSIVGEKYQGYSIVNPISNLAVGDLQKFIDSYIEQYGGRVDYIHGEAVVEMLCKEKNTIGFLLNCMEKSELFETVRQDGVLPRKTFSMGEACDKRFYLECREIVGI